MNGCSWAVCYDIDGKYCDDKKAGTVTVAMFRYPYLAEEFIEKCLPSENRHRFYIKHVDGGDSNQ